MSIQLPRGTFMTDEYEIFSAKKLLHVGKSFAVLLPKTWVRIHAGTGWVRIDYDEATGNMIVRQITDSEMVAIVGGYR